MSGISWCWRVGPELSACHGKESGLKHGVPGVDLWRKSCQLNAVCAGPTLLLDMAHRGACILAHGRCPRRRRRGEQRADACNDMSHVRNTPELRA
uniref:Uncharacterized protein n=1 Tax=Knipowitschia caucasica TaxID=637954 RepID=A0AAV2L7S5_KNICA